MKITREEASLNSVEEGIPATPNTDSTAGASSVVKRQGSSRLSLISKQYDVDGDGKLNEAEQAMRDMDSQNFGYLTNDKVYTIFQEQLRMQKQLLFAKRIIMFCAVLLIILAAANVGVSFAAANLSKDTATNNNVLVVKESGQVVATDNHANVFGVSTSLDTSRRTDVIADGTTSFLEETTISKMDAQAMLSDCQGGSSVHITRSWESIPGLSVNIPVCPGAAFSATQSQTTGDSFHFTLSNDRTITIRCGNSETCTMTGNGVQQEPGESCVFTSDCLYSATCVGVDDTTNTPGSCILPFHAMGCRYANDGSDCETNYCFAGGFSPPIFGYCSCHPTTNVGCTSPRECYTGEEQGFPDSGPSCLLPVNETSCTQDFDCVGRTVGCVEGVCTQL